MKQFFVFLLTALGLAILPTFAGTARLDTSANRLTTAVVENNTVTNTFQLWNGGETPRGQMSYSIFTDVGWLTVLPASGSVVNDTNTITVIFSAGTAATGTYSGTLTIYAMDIPNGAPALGAPLYMPVTLVVRPRTPSNFEHPEIRGIMHVGQTVTAVPGLWQNASRLSFAYQWQMANDKYGNGLKDITNAYGVLITTTNFAVTPDARAKYLRVKVTATDPTPWPLSTTAYSDFADARRINAAPDDFNGDGRTDVWLFEALTGTWRIAFYTNSEATVVFGGPDSSAEPADYDGDCLADPAIYDKSTGLWSVMLSAGGYAVASIVFGGPGFTPVPADFDGDGKADLATYEEATGQWHALLSGNSYQPASIIHGGLGFQAVPADFDGDGLADPAIYEASSGLWLVMLSGSGYAIAGLNFGGPDFTPVPGDYDGDGLADIGIYSATSNLWRLRSTQTGVIREESFGTSEGFAVPAPGYYDYDAQFDPATIHVSGNFMIWGIQLSTQEYRGQTFQLDTGQWRVSW